MLVTGGGRGIGRAVVELAARSGYDVAVNYRADRDAAEATADRCRGAGARAITVRADVASDADVVAMFAAVDAQLGRLDVLVNNAAIVAPQQRVDEMTWDRWRRLFDVNVLGLFACSREAVTRMSTARGGAGGVIVNVASAASYLGGAGEYVDYAASKGAVDSFTVGLGKEVATEGIRVVAVRPGLIATDIHAPGRLERVTPQIPVQRPGEPDEVAQVVLWLASDAASYVTATTVNCSGGR
jgi:NAD(P)-dependent dehydrogenase (short-subunit alcohol dehydrogenase family)